MALNLSRNTKVFVSSVNGVGATGGVKTGDSPIQNSTENHNQSSGTEWHT